jgi:cytochrome b subunit of formate dehydrogenase
MRRTLSFIFVLLFVGALSAFAAGGKKTAPALKSAECLACHGDSGLATERDGKQVSLFVNDAKFKASIHGTMAFECTQCHTDIKAVPHDPKPAKVDCKSCHADQIAQYENGYHGKAVAKGSVNSPTCLSCHGNIHEVLPSSDPNSRTFHTNIPQTCGSCHGNENVMNRTALSVAPFKSYEQSVHGIANHATADKEKVTAAVCTDCHGAHEILAAGDPKSPINKFNVPQTCAKCHDSIKAEYVQSIHGQAAARGNWQAPVCTDCHGIHLIRRPSDPNSPVNGQQMATATCGKCHESVRMSQEFGTPGRRTSTFLSSYHGLAVQGGSKIAANCASCHGVHNILPSNDAKSTINSAHLKETCGKCHPGANDKFIQGKIHIDVPLSADVGSKAVRFIRRFYIGMILCVIGGMFLHNFIIWRRKAVAKRERQRRIVQRMNKAQRYQHLTLLISFFTLVVTGFALKYPDTWFGLIFGLPETIRGWVHRGAGVVLIGVSLYHAVYLATKKDGRKMFKDMLPVPQDAFDVLGVMKYYLGISSERPQLPRFSYAEKMEYLALVWGMFVMAFTGLALWFKVQTGLVAPRWLLDVATAVHFYEAILATLAIIVWHFYWIIFDPDVYPMNWAWFDGKMDVELYHHEHGADHETLNDAIETAASQQDATDEELVGTGTPGPQKRS